MVKVEKHIDELRKNINQMVKLDINSEKFKELQKNNSHIFSKFVSAVNKESNLS